MPETRLKCPNCEAVLKTTAVLPAGKSIKCPKCQGAIRVPGGAVQTAAAPSKPLAARPNPAPPPKKADPDDDDQEREEIADEDETPRARPKPTPGKSPPKKADPDEIDEDEERAQVEDDADEEEPEDKPRKKKKEKDNAKKPGGGNNKMWLWLGIGGGAAAAIAVVLIIVLSGKKDGSDEKGEIRPGGGGGSADHSVERTIETEISLRQQPTERNQPSHLNAAISVSEDGNAIAVVVWESTRKYIIDAKTGKTLAAFEGKKTGMAKYHRPLISPDRQWVVLKDALLELRDAKTGDVKALKDLGNAHRAVFSPRGDVLFGVTRKHPDGILTGWNVATGQEAFRFNLPQFSDEAHLVPLPDGETLLAISSASFAHEAAVLQLWNSRRQARTSTVTTPYCFIHFPSLSPDGKRVAFKATPRRPENVIQESQHTIEVLNIETGKKVCTAGTPKIDSFNDVLSIRFLANGDVAVAQEKCVGLYDGNTGAQKGLWNHKGKVDKKRILDSQVCPNGEIALVLDGETATIQFVRLKE